ncbi:hypothetical protein SAMN06265222_117122 [Neorhodopirellula lusitana]|uniref:Uncharacterized protein n=1 Tax=Neorhodopirellula lusitana TaxID=445327 RepID=A0ABY1QNA0_9BACT|nr:hypothetical protein SAMN06265222_117122 [Neorhodopirellula lusitana]
MGLGEAYLQVFFNIVQLSFLATVSCVGLVRLFKRLRLIKLLLIAFLTWIVLTYTGLRLFHHERFVQLHQSHNTLVPETGCLTYEPTFATLHASYTISADDFGDWVSAYPIAMKEYDSTLQRIDEDVLGFTQPEAAFATEPSSNGAQKRVYYKDGVT